MKNSGLMACFAVVLLIGAIIGIFQLTKIQNGETPEQIEWQKEMQKSAERTQKAYKEKADSFQREIHLKYFPQSQ